MTLTFVSHCLLLVFPVADDAGSGIIASLSQAPWVWCDSKLNRPLYTESEFRMLVADKDRDEITKLLGPPDRIDALAGVCLGICCGADFWTYKNCIDGGSKEIRLSATIAINEWTNKADGVQFFGKTFDTSKP